jgi:hypothetical protein
MDGFVHPVSNKFYSFTCWRSFLARGFFYPEDGGDTFLRNVDDFQLTTRRYIPEDRSLHFDYGVLSYDVLQLVTNISEANTASIFISIQKM